MLLKLAALLQSVVISMVKSMICWNFSKLDDSHLTRIIFLWAIMLIEVGIVFKHSYSCWHLKSDIKIGSLSLEEIINLDLLLKSMVSMINVFVNMAL